MRFHAAAPWARSQALAWSSIPPLRLRREPSWRPRTSPLLAGECRLGCTHLLMLPCCLQHMLWAQLTYAAVECSIFGRDSGVSCRYHSHPIFAPKPSQKDNENQRNYQALFRCAASTLEPFLGAIVGPYDVQLPSPVGNRPGCCYGMHCSLQNVLCIMFKSCRGFYSSYSSTLVQNPFTFFMASLVLSGVMHHLVCGADSARRPGALPRKSQSKRAAGASRRG